MNRERLIHELKADEGTGPVKNGRMFLYRDSTGNWSIGHGRNLSAKGISFQEAHVLINSDLDEAIRDCIAYPWYVDMKDDVPRQVAITNMMFNLGPERFRKFKHMIRS